MKPAKTATADKKYRKTVLNHSLVPLMACLFTLLSMTVPVQAQKKVHSIYFEDSDHELNVYRIHGEEPGKTLFLLGGIQGDEPGGFLSADQYADISLAKGNLIVVPRANFQSILMKKRKINEDMNRKFSGEQKSNYETKIVDILKKLIAESDGLLNLHDGSGFFSDKWENDDRNPMKYGQSVIADCDVYENPNTGDKLFLGEMARSVIQEVNGAIKNPEYHFSFNNHRTAEKRSRHKEQRKSATFYAVYVRGIPAFGIETSKSLPLEKKVLYHNLVINAFMEKFGILPQTPPIHLDAPELKYLIVSVNESLPIAVKNEHTLTVNTGDSIMISHIEANYDRGLTADIIGYGRINDLRKKIIIKAPTRIIARKDYYPCGSVYLTVAEKRKDWINGISVHDKPTAIQPFLSYRIKANDKESLYENYGRAVFGRGDMLQIIDVETNIVDPSELVVNLKGFVGNAVNNTGEDRGYIIDTGKDLWERYSTDNRGNEYQIVVTHNDEIIGKLFINLTDPLQAN